MFAAETAESSPHSTVHRYSVCVQTNPRYSTGRSPVQRNFDSNTHKRSILQSFFLSNMTNYSIFVLTHTTVQVSTDEHPWLRPAPSHAPRPWLQRARREIFGFSVQNVRSAPIQIFRSCSPLIPDIPCSFGIYIIRCTCIYNCNKISSQDRTHARATQTQLSPTTVCVPPRTHRRASRF